MSSCSCVAAPKRSQQVSSSSTPRQPSQRQTLLSCLLLAVCVLVSYSPVTHNGFLNYDDDRYITDNPHVKAGLTWSTVKWAFTTYYQGNWAPLSWLSHALDYELFGLNPAVHHYMSVLLHAANAVLLFLLLQAVTGFRWRSLIVAALFALHPMNVESVAWAAERKNVLSMTFFLLALYAYVWYTRKPALPRYAGVFFLFALGLLSKSQIITFPCLLLLWDYWPLGRISTTPAFWKSGQKPPRFGLGWLALEKVPLLLLSAASAGLTMEAEKAGGAVHSFGRYSLPLRIETAVIAYARYLGKALWPSKLVALYPHPTALYPLWLVGAALLVLLIITALALRFRDKPYLIVGWLWFLGSLVPMIGLVQVGPQAMADRFAYLPLIGIFVMLTWLVADWAKARALPGKWLAMPVGGYLLALGVLTYSQVGYWHDIPSFWLRTLEFTQNNYVAENNLGDFLFNAGRRDEAAAHFRAALAIHPNNMLANLNLAAYEDSRGNMAAAIERYQALALVTADVDVRASAYAGMGFDYRDMGQPAKAKQCFEMAVSLAPHRTRAMVGLGLLAQESGDWPEAIRQYSHAVTVHPTDVSYLLLARAFEHEGRSDQAKAATAHVTDAAAAQKGADSFLPTRSDP
jgi:tetratricopeptide (TPR) repeat protein